MLHTHLPDNVCGDQRYEQEAVWGEAAVQRIPTVPLEKVRSAQNVSGLHKKSPISIVPTSSGGPCADYQCKYRKLGQFFGTLALE